MPPAAAGKKPSGFGRIGNHFMKQIDLASIRQAERTLAGHIVSTPLIVSTTLSRMFHESLKQMGYRLESTDPDG